MNEKKTKEQKYQKKIDDILNEEVRLVEFYDCIKDKTISTVYSYLLILKRFLEQVGDKAFTQLNKTDFEKYMEVIQYNRKGEETSSSYKITTYSALNQFGEYLAECKLLDRNPMEKIKRPKAENNKALSKTEDDFLTENEIQLLLGAIKTGVGSQLSKSRQTKWKERDLSIVILLLTTGLKSSELLKIDIEDIDIKKKTIRVNNDIEVYELSDEVTEVLTQWLEKRKTLLGDTEENALFISNRRSRLDQVTLNMTIGKYADSVDGKKVTAEVLRTTYGVRLYESTKDIAYVQKMMGLTNPLSIMKYVNVRKSGNEQITNITNNVLKADVSKSNATKEEELRNITVKPLRYEWLFDVSENWLSCYPFKIISIAEAKEKHWKYWLYSEAVIYQFQKFKDLRSRSYIRLGRYCRHKINGEEIKEFIFFKITSLTKIISMFKVPALLKMETDNQGESGEANSLLEAAYELSEMYKELILWKIEFETIDIPMVYKTFYEYVIKVGEDVLKVMDEFVEKCKCAINRLNMMAGEKNQEDDLNVDFDLSILENISLDLDDKIAEFLFEFHMMAD